MAVKRVVMQHFSMNLALEARLRSLDEDSGLGHEPEVVEMDVDSQSVDNLDDTIQFGHLSLDGDDTVVVSKSSMSSTSMDTARNGESRKKVTFGLAPPAGSRLAQRRLKSCLSLDALTTTSNGN